MLRRIHDPERGASLLEYGAVVVLCVALLAALVGSGLVGTVGSGTKDAIDQLFSAEEPGSDDGVQPQNGSDGGDEAPSGETEEEDGGGEDAGADDTDGGDDDGGFMDALGDAWDGASDAVGNIWEDGKESVSDLWEGAQDLWDDPGQWVEDTWNSTVDDAGAIWDRATEDPWGLARDFFASDEAQDRWNDGDYWGAGGMVVVENAEALIPVWGWNKKRERLGDLADAARRGDDDGNDGGDGPDEGDDRADGADDEQPDEEDEGESEDDGESDGLEPGSCRRYGYQVAPTTASVPFSAPAPADGDGNGSRRSCIPDDSHLPEASELIDNGTRYVKNGEYWRGRNLPASGGPENGTLYKQDPQTGDITNYIVYDENGNAIKRVDLTGAEHAGVPTPHVIPYRHNYDPEGNVRVQGLRNDVRPARSDEIP